MVLRLISNVLHSLSLHLFFLTYNGAISCYFMHLNCTKQWNASSSSSSASTEKCPSQSRINTKIVSIKIHQPTHSIHACSELHWIIECVINYYAKYHRRQRTQCIYFYDKNNDLFEETDIERCGVCEKLRA